MTLRTRCIKIKEWTRLNNNKKKTPLETFRDCQNGFEIVLYCDNNLNKLRTQNARIFIFYIIIAQSYVLSYNYSTIKMLIIAKL